MAMVPVGNGEQNFGPDFNWGLILKLKVDFQGSGGVVEMGQLEIFKLKFKGKMLVWSDSDEQKGGDDGLGERVLIG